MKTTDETENIENTANTENTEGTGNTEDAENATDMENAEGAEGAKDTGNAKGEENSENAEDATEAGNAKGEENSENAENAADTGNTKDEENSENTEGAADTEGTGDEEDTGNTESTESTEGAGDIENIGNFKDILDIEGLEDVSGSDKIATVSGGNGEAGNANPQSGFLALAVVGAIVLIMAVLWVLFQKKMKKQEDRTQAPESDFHAEKIHTEEIMIGEQTYRVGKLHCIGRRESQQDSFAVSEVGDKALCEEKGVIVIVADGMGGLSDGDKISSMITLSFFRHFHERPAQDNAGSELLQMLKEANGEVNRYLGSKTGQCGSTLVAGIVRDRKCHWISVGDSHIYLYKNGGLIQLNREHVYREELDAKAANGEISREEAMRNPQRGALTSYIGMGRIEKVDRNQEPLILYPGDRLLFMTDGVFGTLSDAQIAEAMHYPMEESIRLMDESIRAVGKPRQDNYTAVILECR